LRLLRNLEEDEEKIEIFGAKNFEGCVGEGSLEH
jgi:hypothetical protein